MFKTLQFIGVVAAMSLGVVVSVKPTAGSVSGPGGQAAPCDVNFLPQEPCPSQVEDIDCHQPMDMAGDKKADKKLANVPGIDNCNNYYDGDSRKCKDVPQVRILEEYNCETAPPPPPL